MDSKKNGDVGTPTSLRNRGRLFSVDSGIASMKSYRKKMRPLSSDIEQEWSSECSFSDDDNVSINSIQVKIQQNFQQFNLHGNLSLVALIFFLI